MDDRRFDAFTRAAGAAPSRRSIIGAMVAAAFGTGAARGAVAAQVGAEAFDLTCRQNNTKFYCRSGADTVTPCGNKNCLCAEQKGGGARCIQEPATGCPSKRNRCRDNGDCGDGHVCIKVSDCCPDNPSRGKCVAKCPA